MKTLMFALVGFVLVGGLGQALASPFPSNIASRVDNGVVLVTCVAGGKHCVGPVGKQPTPCYKSAKGCSIDGGLGSTCEGGGTCGTGPSGPPGNPYFPYGSNSRSATPVTVGSPTTRM